MDVGYTMHVRNRPDRRRPLQDVYQDFLDDCRFVEEIGFDSVWLAEHHFAVDQRLPSPLPFLAAIAAHTERVRLGTAVLCLPYHNPLRVAEDAAVVDNLSGGRLDLGIAVGSTPRAFRTFGVPHEERFGRTYEAAALIERCFSETEPFDHEGRYFRFPGVDVTTKPTQARLPIWWGGTGPKGVAMAARRGYHLLATSDLYDDALRDAGRDPSAFGTTETLVMHLAPTREQAWDEAEEGVHWFCEFYRRQNGVPAGATADGPLDELPPVGALRDVPGLRRFPSEEPFLIGTPQDALEVLLPLRDGRNGRLTQVLVNGRLPGIGTRAVRSSLQLFADECLPLLRAVTV